MDREALARILQQVRTEAVSVEQALSMLLPAEVDLGFAHLDLDRRPRTGLPEVVYGEGKTGPQITAILRALHEAGEVAVATRVDATLAAEVCVALPGVTHHAVARVLVWLPEGRHPEPSDAPVAVVCAGTSDLPVAEEAAVVLEAFGLPVHRVRDVGVAGLHRLMPHVETLRACRAVVVVAGMEGALPSVVAGLVGRPVVAVPTSVGYGAAFGGIAPLLGMLNACAPGVSVVNIDNGFGAASVAALIAGIPTWNG
ncbi:MAG: nickel pincer cofactor biosynthesis protein LarB [Deltaproteobacteria bacterium]|nr:nickel pincer cofactor biosynthesis protein LarB [Deltaproteobacteria bacterium]